MKNKIKILILLLLFFIVSIKLDAVYVKPEHIEQEVWDKVAAYLIPEDHPAKIGLDSIFSNYRANLSLASMEQAGFRDPKIRQWTHIAVTSHRNIPGYIFKVYIDAEPYHSRSKKDYYYLLKRIEGSRKIREEITNRKLNHLFKVPHKWIYLIPSPPPPPEMNFQRKNFILIAEDMDIFNEEENAHAWKSEKISQDTLRFLYFICEDLGLEDCSKADNIPFCKDGRIAFIDTQTYDRWPVRYKNLEKVLSEETKLFWKKLTKNSSNERNVE